MGQTAAPAAPPQLRQPPAPSPQLLPDGRVTFRLLAPHATSVAVAGDIYQGLPRAGTTLAPPSSIPMNKGSDGVWTGTSTSSFLPGAWRYHFRVDSMDVPDPRNVRSSPLQNGMERLLIVPGDFSETRSVPHGAVARVVYNASTFKGAAREMYIYTPPGYEKGEGTFPVFYLLHGGGETDSSWSTVGRAGDILDNLIAAGKAKPMIIVMPSGWTPTGPQVMTGDATKDPFNNELIHDIIPFVDTHYRTHADAENRALGGLSMGGIQTLNIGLHNLGTFRWLVVMSSGWFPADRKAFFSGPDAARIPQYNSELKLFWWGWGQTDIARDNAIACVARFKADGVHLETEETPDGHEWKNWRLYLYQVAPILFR
ncbi:MAG: esterase [Acidobacteria bacterium]|nr:esterase [Acidobacteriota bacterium]